MVGVLSNVLFLSEVLEEGGGGLVWCGGEENLEFWIVI